MTEKKESPICSRTLVEGIIRKKGNTLEDNQQAQPQLEVELAVMVQQVYHLVETIIDMVPMNRKEFFRKELVRIKRLQEVVDNNLIWEHLSNYLD